VGTHFTLAKTTAPPGTERPLREHLPAAGRVAVNREIQRAADDLASAYARSQGQIDCEPVEVAEWVADDPDETGESDMVNWSPAS